MPRIRSIKPEFWADEKLGPMDPLTRLVFVGLISMADDAGRLIDSVKQIDALLFAFTDDSAREALANLSRSGRIVRGLTASGQRIIQIVNWHHQKVDHPNLRAALPVIAQALTGDSREVSEDVASDSRGARDTISTSDLRSTTSDLRPAGAKAPSRAPNGTNGHAPRAHRRVRPAPPAWAERLAKHWSSRVGDVKPAAVAKALASAVEQRDEARVLAGMDGWLAARSEMGRDPKLAWFAEVALVWADRVAKEQVEPLLDNGWMSPALERETRP